MIKTRRYLKSEMDYLLDIRKRIMTDQSSDLDSESRMLLFKWIKELYYAQIPRAYWTLNFEQLAVDLTVKKIVREFIFNLDNAVKSGLGITFLGESGVGKTSMMAEVGKEGIRQGYQVIYMTLESYITCDRTKDKDEIALEMNDRILGSDIILLDEIDKVYIKDGSDWVIKRFTDLIKKTMPYHKVIVMAMNMAKDELHDTFGTAVISAMERHLKFLPVVGDDYSKNLQKEWMAKLRGKGNKHNFFDSELLKQASQYYEATAKIEKAQYEENWD